jgi:hypothetical protein
MHARWITSANRTTRRARAKCTSTTVATNLQYIEAGSRLAIALHLDWLSIKSGANKAILRLCTTNCLSVSDVPIFSQHQR